MTEESLKNSLLAISVRSKVVITLNYWSSQSRKAFLIITYYFFTQEFKYWEILLGFKKLVGSYDG